MNIRSTWDLTVEESERWTMKSQSIWDLSDDECEPCSQKYTVQFSGLKYEVRAVNAFQDLRFHDDVLKGFHYCNFYSPYNIQKYILPVFCDQRFINVIVNAPNKSGKSTAMLMSVLQKVRLSDFRPLQFLIICPTRDSAETNFNLMCKMSKYCPKISVHLLMRSSKPKNRFDGQILIGTPEKIWQYLKNGFVSFKNLQSLIFDNCEHDKKIFQIASHVTSFRNIIALCSFAKDQSMSDFNEKLYPHLPFVMDFSIVDTIKQVKSEFIISNSFHHKISILKHLLKTVKGQIIAFCRMRDDIKLIYDRFNDENNDTKQYVCRVSFLHGKLPKMQRDKTLFDFSQNCVQFLICTRSFDIQSSNLEVIINCDVIATKDKRNLDHAYYKKNYIFRGDSGLVINILDKSWAKCATNEHGEKINVLQFEELIVKYPNLSQCIHA